MALRGYARNRSIEPHQQAAKRNGRISSRLIEGGNRVQARVRRDIHLKEMPYRLLSLSIGILGGAIAGAIVSRTWGVFSDRDDLPESTALDVHLREVLIAGAVQGVVFGVVKAALGRVTAKTYRHVTGSDLKH